jgi:Fe2+ or Zn2+ uptake regulation protein
MVAESVPGKAGEAVAQARAELLQAFGLMGGVTARAEEFSRVLPRCSAAAVWEALEALVEEGSVEVASLSDGAAVYHFVRH